MAEESSVGIAPKIFNALGLLFCAIFTFMGLIYVLHGNIWLTAFFSALVLVALMLLSSYLTIYKTKKRDYRTFVPELIIGSAYFLVFLFIFPFTFHFIDVDFSRKNELKKAGKDKIGKVTELQSKYMTVVDEKVNSFKDSVTAATDAYFVVEPGNKTKYRAALKGFLGESTILFYKYESNPSDGTIKSGIRTEINNAVQEKEGLMRAKYDLGKLNTEYEKYKSAALPVFENWNFLKVSYYYYDIDNMYSKMYNLAVAKMPDFQYPSSIDLKNIEIDNTMKSVSNASVPKIGLILLLVVLLHLCILAPYLVAKRPAEMIKKYEGPYDSTGSIDLKDVKS